jgi:orotidine-5'-phosphate decarboxylase
MKIILSLETEEALDVFPYLGKYVDGVKINHLLWNEVDFDVEKDKELFIDFKLLDTPNTVKTVVERIIKKGGTMTTISTFNNEAVFKELEQYSKEIKLLAVTYLTSWNKDEQYQICREMPDFMWRRHLGRVFDHGFYGVVCSAWDIGMLSGADPSRTLKRICPGITIGSDNSGQSRTATPQQAEVFGADYIVLGRSITEAENPIKILKELKKRLDK